MDSGAASIGLGLNRHKAARRGLEPITSGGGGEAGAGSFDKGPDGWAIFLSGGGYKIVWRLSWRRRPHGRILRMKESGSGGFAALAAPGLKGARVLGGDVKNGVILSGRILRFEGVAQGANGGESAQDDGQGDLTGG